MSTGLGPAPGAPAVVLASQSRTRRALLEAAGVAHEAEPARVDEDEIRRAMRADGAPVAAIAERLAETKALRVSRRRPAALVIGCDQMLECGAEHFDKPATRAEAAAQLASLAGRTHRLVSSAVVAQGGVRIWHATDAASLAMRPLTPAFIAAYLDVVGDAALASVGSYQLEGLGAQLFARVDGDWFTVLGMPLLPLLEFLRARGVLTR